MQAIKRHALGLGLILFAAGTCLLLVPVTESGFGCGNTIWAEDDTLRRVEVATPDGDVVELPHPDDVAARDDCHHERRTHTILALCLGGAGLIGVFWSVVGAPELRKPRESILE